MEVGGWGQGKGVVEYLRLKNEKYIDAPARLNALNFENKKRKTGHKR